LLTCAVVFSHWPVERIELTSTGFGPHPRRSTAASLVMTFSYNELISSGHTEPRTPAFAFLLRLAISSWLEWNTATEA
jgi:hypothetical protein